MPRFGSHSNSNDPRAENQQRLRAYELAESGDQRSQLSSERLDFQRQKEAFEEAYKTSEAERKAGEFSQRLDISDRRAVIMDERMKLQSEISKNNDLLKQQAALAKDKATLSRQNAAKEFYSGIAKLDPQSHDFQTGFSNLMSKVQSNLVDSEGKLPEDVNKVADHMWQQHNTWAATSLKAKSPTDSMNAFHDALASSTPAYGYMDGKTFVPTKAGDTNSAGPNSKEGEPQPFVQTTYVPPGSNKPVTQVFPRDVFDSAVAASKSRTAPQTADTQQSAPVDTPAPAHPLEGQRVLQKSTGQYGTFTNGQFTPEQTASDSTQD